MVDLIKLSVEDIHQRLSRAELHPEAVKVIIELHEQTVMLQAYCQELSKHVEGTINLIKLSQALHRENKAKLEKIEKRYSDPYGTDVVKSEDIN